MTYHNVSFFRYGDKAPKTLLGRVVAVIWIMIGLVVFGLLSGCFATVFMVSSVADGNYQLYGAQVRTVVVKLAKGKRQRAYKYVIGAEITFSLSSSKSTFSQPFKEKCISELVRISSMIIRQLPTLWSSGDNSGGKTGEGKETESLILAAYNRSRDYLFHSQVQKVHSPNVLKKNVKVS